MDDTADTVILHQELAYQDVLPVAWHGLDAPLDAAAVASLTDRNVKTLQVCAAVDEAGPVERPDENSPNATDLQRIEIKLNLVLDLLGQIVAASLPRPAAASVRFNARGASWRMRDPRPEPGALGLLDIHLRDSVAQPLTLALQVVDVTPDGVVTAVTLPPGEAVADLIEKLAFRRHRRRVAGTRQPRRS
jgi:hypothetical protein